MLRKFSIRRVVVSFLFDWLGTIGLFVLAAWLRINIGNLPQGLINFYQRLQIPLGWTAPQSFEILDILSISVILMVAFIWPFYFLVFGVYEGKRNATLSQELLNIFLAVTTSMVFLAGLLPGAVYGDHMRRHGNQLLAVTELALIALMVLFLTGMILFSEHLPAYAFLLFGFGISFVCGCQFPTALHLQGGDKPAAVKMFSADLIGAAYGTLLTSILLIPYAGILWTATALMALKTISLITLSTKKS